jgi:hypothetical protein
MPGRIHISEATAQLLFKDGKNHWISKRTDLVAPKGKGIMQTYWVTAGGSGGLDESTTH